MAEAISSSSSVASGAQLTALALVQSQLVSDSTSTADSVSAQAPGQALAAAQSATAATLAAGAPSSKATKPSGPQAEATELPLEKAVESLQAYLKPQESITLQVDKDSGETYVKIVDTSTKRMILQIPSAQVLAMARKLQQMADPQGTSGVLVDQQG